MVQAYLLDQQHTTAVRTKRPWIMGALKYAPDSERTGHAWMERLDELLPWNYLAGE